MLKDIFSSIPLLIVNFVVTGFLGYLVALVKNYNKKEKNQEKALKQQEEALKCLLRNGITSKYYVYYELGEIPYYEKENIDYMFEQYKNMGGNSYVANIVEEIHKLPIKK